MHSGAPYVIIEVERQVCFMSFNIEDYSGMALADKLTDLGRDVFLSNLEYMRVAFGNNVEYQRLLHQTLLCPETEEALYAPPAPVEYKRGSRPILERVVDEVTRGARTQCDAVIALALYIRDLKKKSGGRGYFYGGTEEELIKKGERYCERVARLMCALCEIAGMPGRVVFHLSGGHLASEIFADGEWRYIDPRFALFYLDGEGNMVSVRRLIAEPELIYSQSEEVYALGSEEYTPEFMAKENHDKYLRKNEIQLYGSYSLSDAERYGYNYEWMPSSIHKVPERDVAYRGYYNALNAYLALDGLKI